MLPPRRLSLALGRRALEAAAATTAGAGTGATGGIRPRARIAPTTAAAAFSTSLLPSPRGNLDEPLGSRGCCPPVRGAKTSSKSGSSSGGGGTGARRGGRKAGGATATKASGSGSPPIFFKVQRSDWFGELIS